MIKHQNQYGTIEISEDVVSHVIGYAVSNCFGVAGMASRTTADGLAALLKKDNLDKGVKVEYKDGALRVALHIIVTYGLNIPAITASIREKIRYVAGDILEVDVKTVDVHIDSMKMD
jgi:uncharacterized alkaline shock family protein YloU